MFVNTMLETRRFGFIANVYLSEAEIDAIKQAKQSTLTDTTDTSLIKLPNQSSTETGGDNQTDPAQPDGTDGYGLVDDERRRDNHRAGQEEGLPGLYDGRARPQPRVRRQA